MRLSICGRLMLSLGLLLIVALPAQSAPKADELPTMDEVLAIHRANAASLSCLHLQVIHRYELTENQARQEADSSAAFAELIKRLEALPADASYEIEGRVLQGPELHSQLPRYIAHLKQQQEFSELQAKRFTLARQQEYFLRGRDYQFRTPKRFPEANEEPRFRFPTEIPTTARLGATYGDVRIFTYQQGASPAGREWNGGDVLVTSSHLTKRREISLPPYTSAIEGPDDKRHPIDVFFSQKIGDYKVVGQESLQGRTMTVVEVAIPWTPQMTHHYRAWLDLARGAMPLKIHRVTTLAGKSPTKLEAAHPNDIITVEEVKQLAADVFYPAKTKRDHFMPDPTARLTQDQWKEVSEGRRTPPKWVVGRRYTWDCTLVELDPQLPRDFFTLKLPGGGAVYDDDTGKRVGELPSGKLVEVGEVPPPLKIAR